MTGSVYLGKDIKRGKEVALKVERHRGSHSDESDLFHEYEIYKEINGCQGISKVYWYGSEGPYNVMVMNRYDYSLDDMVRRVPPDLPTIVSFAGQMVSFCPMILMSALTYYLVSYVPWNHFTHAIIFIVTSSLTIL